MQREVYTLRSAPRNTPSNPLASYVAMTLVRLDALLAALEPTAGEPFNDYRSTHLDAVTGLYELLSDLLAHQIGGLCNA